MHCLGCGVDALSKRRAHTPGTRYSIVLLNLPNVHEPLSNAPPLLHHWRGLQDIAPVFQLYMPIATLPTILDQLRTFIPDEQVRWLRIRALPTGRGIVQRMVAVYAADQPLGMNVPGA